MTKYSIILPTYNVSKYILTCIDSLLNQDYPALEIIVVNDGSTDYVKDVLNQYIANGTIKYIWQENQGVSAARNTGLAAATGDYVYFCDPDDYVMPDFLKVINDTLEKFRYDIISFNLYYNIVINEEVKGSKILGFEACNYRNTNDIIERILPKHMGTTQGELDMTGTGNPIMSSHVTTGIWMHCFNKDFLDKWNLSFNEQMKLGEDRLFISRALCYADTYLHLDNPLYVYQYRNNGCFSTLTQKSPQILISSRLEWLNSYTLLQKEMMSLRQIDLFPFYMVTCLLFLEDAIFFLIKEKFFKACPLIHGYLVQEDVNKAIRLVRLDKCAKRYKFRFTIHKLHLTYIFLFLRRVKYRLLNNLTN